MRRLRDVEIDLAAAEFAHDQPVQRAILRQQDERQDLRLTQIGGFRRHPYFPIVRIISSGFSGDNIRATMRRDGERK